MYSRIEITWQVPGAAVATGPGALRTFKSVDFYFNQFTYVGIVCFPKDFDFMCYPEPVPATAPDPDPVRGATAAI